MRIRSIVATASLTLAAAAACTMQTPPDPRNVTLREGTVEVPDAAVDTESPPETCLSRAGLDFDDPACNECMNAESCCQAAIDCFKNDPNCNNLQMCMAGCGTGSDAGAADGGDGGDGGGDGGGGGDGTGGGNGDGTGGGTGGGRDACYTRCKTIFAAGIPKWTTYTACVTGTCAGSCM